MQTQSVAQNVVSNQLLAFGTQKSMLNPFNDLANGYERSMLMTSLIFSCSGPYDPPVYPDYADPDSHP